ncbi:SagB/ThcOx family dehydrogenase [Thermobispora bispora]|uniref:Uncharacterized protein n=1 Tax=Thermobispora bispora (strain ATCC 19993 / DSM 43833 / CBS 139.67 / JCM 10125 / KCTC 9307 / NBRC 14880 / R51) TaxID=469371 RepID=D6Y505_THEBD|nr:SagB family peptide dehydrogenase [Thermobispora bispora]ADG87280.1 conserved hypothetical protein [Thermobispora bispora DSM 43833]
MTIPPGLTERYALRAGVHSAVLPDGVMRLFAWPHAESIGALSADETTLLKELAEGPREIADPALRPFVERLFRGGWLKRTLSRGEHDLYTLDPLRRPGSRPAPPDDPVLSRFAAVRRRPSGFVIESPLAWCDVHVHDPALLPDLLEPAGGRAGRSSLAPQIRRQALADLAWAGLVVPRGAEDGALRTRQWAPHELDFHQRSRLYHRGYLGDGFGGTFWARGTFDPPQARPQRYPGDPIPLHRPDLNALRAADPPLTAVLEDRRSVREYDDDAPMTVEQLGELLYRSARIRDVKVIDGVEYVRKPYPSGGSVYELEIYPVVRHVAGLAPGMYHYDAYEHVLRPVRPAGHPAVRRMLTVASHGSAVGIRPQLLLVVSARVGRVMWKYEGMGYALILKHVGVLYQTLYCVATAMGLAPCAIGSGDSAAFSEATGRDPLEECAVGDFLLGSRPASGSTVEES